MEHTPWCLLTPTVQVTKEMSLLLYEFSLKKAFIMRAVQHLSCQ